MLEVSPLLHLVASQLGNGTELDDVAGRVATELGRPVSTESITHLLERKLRPLGIISTAGDPEPEMAAAAPILAMTVRAAVIPRPAVKVATTLLRPLFLPPIVAAALVGLLTVDRWLLLGHDAGRAAHDLMSQPLLLLIVIGLTLTAAIFHELGHATASSYGGAEPGVIGAGIYLMWPVFFNDLNDSYRLSRRGRLRADLGGVYFNVVFILVMATVYGATAFAPLLVVIVVQHLAIVQQFVPFLRLDGYYVVSDLAGVPDLFTRIRPILGALICGRRPAQALMDLRPRVRSVVIVWVLTTVPLLAGMTVLVVAALPSLLAVGWESVGAQSEVLAKAVGERAPVPALLSGVQIVLLSVPVVGISGLLLRVVRYGRRRRHPDVRRLDDVRPSCSVDGHAPAQRPRSRSLVVVACFIVLLVCVTSDVRSRSRHTT